MNLIRFFINPITMLSNKSVSKKRSSCSGRGQKGIDAIKKAAFKNKRFSSLDIILHIKKTTFKGTHFATTKPQSSPFLHPILTNVNLKNFFDEIEDLIEDVVKTNEFKARYGDGITYDVMRGFVGWKGRREEDNCPQSKLRSKGINGFASNSDWVSHYQKFGTTRLVIN